MSVKITLIGDGLNYEADATIVQAARIIGFLNTDESGAMDTQPSGGTATTQSNFIDSAAPSRASSPREALLESGAKTNAQKLLVLGKYASDRDDTEEFLQSELRNLFVKAGEPAPRNLARDLRDAIRAGYITESIDTTGAFFVTNTGRKTLEEGFPAGSTGRRKRSGGSSAGTKSKTRTVPDWFKEADFSDQLEGFPGYRQMKLRSNKVLWLLQWALKNSRDRVTTVEIEQIADKLSDNVPSRQIAAATAPYLSKNMISKNADGYKILHPGTEFLKNLGQQTII